MSTTTPQPTPTSIHPDTVMGLLSLTVADLERSLAFYTEAMGFEVLKGSGANAILGAGGRPLLLLSERAGAQAWPLNRNSYAGLYHFAILMPMREDLGLWLRHWLEIGMPLPGQGDHLVSEALYLQDPDGNGIEVYRDRPRSEWTWDEGRVRMAADPVDIRGILRDAEASGRQWTGMPAGTTLGHVHLQVGDIPRAVEFYHDVLGFDIVAQMPSALFVSAGGYHHHLGMNTWHSQGAGRAPEGYAGLRFYTIDFASEEARQAVLDRLEAVGIDVTRSGNVAVVRDPWENVIVMQVGSANAAETAQALIDAFAENFGV